MKKQVLLGACALVVIVAVVVWQQSQNNSSEISAIPGQKKMMVDKDTESMMQQNQPSKDTMMKKVDNTMMQDVTVMQFDHTGKLDDVTGGNSSGTASFSFKNGSYNLLATFENLPEPQNNDFYEGWIVQKSPFKFLSSGKVEKVNGVYTNTYSSGQDLSSYNFYVLTLEPNDGNPAPDKHIVEGLMIKN